MPGALLFPAAGPAAAVTLVACKKAAITTVDAALAFTLSRLAWNQVPDWIKEDVAVRHLFTTSTKTTTTTLELATLASVVEKLQALVESASSKSQQKIPYLHASILAYWQLSAQLRRLYPDQRNEWYAQSGYPVAAHPQTTILENVNQLKLAGGNVDLRLALDLAVWAYESNTDTLQEWLQPHDFMVQQHNTLVPQGRTVRPGYVGHYVAVSAEQKLVVIGVRGTSTLEEILTDCCGRAVSLADHHASDGTDEHLSVEVQASQPHSIYDDDDSDGIEVVSGHERIWIKEHDEPSEHSDDAIRCHEGILICAKRLVNVIQALVEEHVIENGLDLLLCGHSLGAGVASLTAFLLRSRYPQLAMSNRVHVVAFAPPPVLDHDTALGAASYTTCIVHNSDIIPRSSLVNLAVCLELLRSISQRLQDLGLAPTNPSTATALIRKLSQNPDQATPDDLLLSQPEFTELITKAHEKIQLREPDHLYIPGRVFLLYEKWDPVTTKKGKLQVMETDGCSPVLRFLEVDAMRMVTDHVTASYYDCLDRLAALPPIPAENDAQ